MRFGIHFVKYISVLSHVIYIRADAEEKTYNRNKRTHIYVRVDAKEEA